MAIVVVPLGAASSASAAAVLVDIFISKLILIDYILCTREEQQQQLDRATLTRSLRLSTSLDILNYHFIYNLPASCLSRFGNNVILLLVDFVFETTASAENVIKVTWELRLKLAMQKQFVWRLWKENMFGRQWEAGTEKGRKVLKVREQERGPW